MCKLFRMSKGLVWLNEIDDVEVREGGLRVVEVSLCFVVHVKGFLRNSKSCDVLLYNKSNTINLCDSEISDKIKE
jgi:hypothetical protein